MELDLAQFVDQYVVPSVMNIVTAIAVFFVGRAIARLIVRGAGALMDRSQMDTSLRKFLTDVLYAVLLVAVITAALDAIGVETTAVIAVLGAAGLAVGLALQGSLSNFAAGVMIIVLRPYRVGDLVAIGKYVGTVDAIRVFHTILVTGDHREIIIPNGKIISDSIENLTVLGTRRVEIVVSVAHGTNLHQAREWLAGVVSADDKVHASPAPSIDLAEVGPEAVKLYLRPWTSVEDYAAVAARTMEKVKETLEGHGVKFQLALQA
jgi:small conductance mechanosensitive channel